MDFQQVMLLQDIASRDSLIQKQRDEIDHLESKITNLTRLNTTYERFLHALQMNVEVTMNNENVRSLLRNACRWSYAHRIGNGEYSDKEQNEIVENAFRRLLECNDAKQ